MLGVNIVNRKERWIGHFLRINLTVCTYVPQHLVKLGKQYLLIELWMILSTYLQILITKVLVKRNLRRVRKCYSEYAQLGGILHASFAFCENFFHY